MQTIVIDDMPGTCRWCGSTDEQGCAWGNKQRTVCTACLSLDQLVRTERGRRWIARTLQRAERCA